MRLTNAAHGVFAATMIAVGILGVVTGAFTVMWQPVPRIVPGHGTLTFLCGFIPIACGIGLLWPRCAAAAARVLLAYLVVCLLAFRVPPLFRSLGVDVYWSVCSTAVMVSAAWVLYIHLAGDRDRHRLAFASGDAALQAARGLYGLALIPFGLAHFQYLAHTASLVPGWLPAPVAWAYLTGGTFIAAGVAALVGVYARLAVALSALQMGLFLLLVWAPVAATGALTKFQSDEIVTTWLLTAAGWVVASSYRSTPWFALKVNSAMAASGSIDFTESGR